MQDVLCAPRRTQDAGASPKQRVYRSNNPYFSYFSYYYPLINNPSNK